jgi:hypothetical protein
MITRLLLVGGLALAAGGAAAKECRPPADWPPGVRPPAGRDCVGPAPPVKPFREETRAGRDPGTIDLGNGSSVRVGGRVRVDAATRR